VRRFVFFWMNSKKICPNSGSNCIVHFAAQWRFGLIPALGCFLLLIAAAGCAPVQLVKKPLEPELRQQLAAGYGEKIKQLDTCDHFEADTRVQFESFWKDAVVSGLLLAKAPGYMKFVGLSPFGQPLVILALEDASFTFVDVIAQRGFTGSIFSEKVEAVVPIARMGETELYSILAGVPKVGDPLEAIIERSNADEQSVYQLTWRTGQGVRQRVFYDQTADHVAGYQLLDDSGSALIDVKYFDELDGQCILPGRVVISGAEMKGSFEVKIDRLYVPSALSEKDFKIILPEGYPLKSIQ
jgi:hypothetical protein